MIWECNLYSIVLASILSIAGIHQAPERSITVKETFDSGWEMRWKPHTAGSWVVERESSKYVLKMTKAGVPPKEIRRPGEYAVWSSKVWGDVEFTAQVRCDQDVSVSTRDAILIFAYQDDTHFYYVHLAGRADSVHNAIMVVNGKDRERIDKFDSAHLTKPALTDKEFHTVKVVRNIKTGTIDVYLDRSDTPLLHAEDRTILKGMLGLGSFDDTASFHSLVAKGRPELSAPHL